MRTNAKWYLAFASGYSVNASHKSSLDNENKSEYPTLLTLAVLRFPVLFPGMFKILTSPKTAPSANVTNTVVPSSATTSEKKRQQKSVAAQFQKYSNKLSMKALVEKDILMKKQG